MTQNEEITVFESQESSSPITTRAVAGALQHQNTETYHLSAWQRQALRILSKLPQGAARFLIPRVNACNGLDPDKLRSLTTEQLATQRLHDYANLTGRYPCITVGAALGGASAALSAALGGPFLPQAFVITLKGGSLDGKVRQYFQQIYQVALQITQNNREIFSIQHYDPVHDEWMTRRVNHLRLKLIDLPICYRTFIHDYLQPGGSICYLDCQASWFRYRVGERNVFQVGGWGDITPDEYLTGSTRLDQFARTVGLSVARWPLDDFSLETGAESEWGTEPGLFEALKQYCDVNGYHFFHVTFPEPHDYSRLAFRAINHILKVEGRNPGGVVVEMFTQFDTTSIIQTGLLPLWLAFNTHATLSFLREIIPEFPEGTPVFFHLWRPSLQHLILYPLMPGNPLSEVPNGLISAPALPIIPQIRWQSSNGQNHCISGAKRTKIPSRPVLLLKY